MHFWLLSMLSPGQPRLVGDAPLIGGRLKKNSSASESAKKTRVSPSRP